MTPTRQWIAGAALLFALHAQLLRAQVQTGSTATPMGRALMAERNGAWADAATQYAAILSTQPASLGALMGMEHILPKLDRGAELLPLVERALAADSTGVGILTLAVRTFATSGQADSARKYVERWSATSPGDEEPYRAWAEAAGEMRDMAQMRLALDLGRAKLGANALGIERAQMMQQTGDLAGAAQEWVTVVRATPAFRDGAASVLAQAPANQRSAIRAALQQDNSRDARQILGLLLPLWGDPAAGATLIRGALPTEPDAATALLRKLLDELHGHDDRASHLASAATLEAIAERETAAARVHSLMDAARAYADAGDERNARRLLAIISSSPDVPDGLATNASTTLLGVLIAEGKGAEAERVLTELGERIGPDEHDRLARRIATIWIRAGDFARADQLIARDSSVAGFDLRGRLRLYRGDLAGANDLLKAAGPYDDERENALERVTLLALIQAVGQDSSIALGAALATLERGDSAAAVTQLEALAATLKPAGAAETMLLAGRVAAASRDTASALRDWHAADLKDAPATAAAARLGLARLSAASGHAAEARATLERLIIDFPESALVPEARRLRDSLAGAVPAIN